MKKNKSCLLVERERRFLEEEEEEEGDEGKEGIEVAINVKGGIDI